MNEFAGLLPPRRGVPAPAAGDPYAVLAVAASRRRRRIVGTSVGVALLVAGGLAVGLRGGPGGRVRLDPVATPTLGSPATPPSGAVGPAATPPGRQPAGVLPTAPPAMPRAVSPDPPSSPASPPPGQRRYTTYTTSVVADQPAPCDRTLSGPGTRTLCYRYLGPTTAYSGRATTLTYEFCSLAGDVSFYFPRHQESKVGLYAGHPVWEGFERLRNTAHTRLVAQGRCVRYAAYWDGRDDAGKPLAPGTYRLAAWLLDNGPPDTRTGADPSITVR